MFYTAFYNQTQLLVAFVISWQYIHWLVIPLLFELVTESVLKSMQSDKLLTRLTADQTGNYEA